MAFYEMLILLFFSSVHGKVTESLSFESCGIGGWSCSNETKGILDIYYKCNQTNVDLTIGEAELKIPHQVKSLTIQDCATVQLSFTSNFAYTNFSSTTLTIRNCLNVTLLPASENVTLPIRLALENIKFMKSIKSYSFSGNWDSLLFYNVTIENIESDSFIHMTVRKSIKWDNVKVNLLDSNALNYISTNEFIISNSYIGVFELMSFNVQARKVIIENSLIDDIRFSGIIVLADTFHLLNNSGFRVVMPNALNVLAREVVINGNKFMYLQTDALEQIGPTLLEEVSNPKVSYSFQNNHIDIADIGSLHVNLVDYLKIGGTLFLGNNTFSCSCTHLGWLGLEAPPHFHFPELYQFHQRLLLLEENNTCSAVPCYLPVNIMQELIKTPNVCTLNLTGFELCEMFPQFTRTTRLQVNTTLSPQVSRGLRICPVFLFVLLGLLHTIRK